MLRTAATPNRVSNPLAMPNAERSLAETSSYALRSDVAATQERQLAGSQHIDDDSGLLNTIQAKGGALLRCPRIPTAMPEHLWLLLALD